MRIAVLRGITASFLVLGFGAAFFAANMLLEDVTPPAARPIQAWTPALADAAADAQAELEPKDTPQTFARPAFLATRRPFVAFVPPAPPPEPDVPVAPPAEVEPAPPPEVEAAPPPPILDPQLVQLKGIMVLDGAKRALLSWPDQPDGAWISEGAMVGDWQITAIDAAGIKLAHEKQTAEIYLYVDNPLN